MPHYIIVLTHCLDRLWWDEPSFVFPFLYFPPFIVFTYHAFSPYRYFQIIYIFTIIAYYSLFQIYQPLLTIDKFEATTLFHYFPVLYYTLSLQIYIYEYLPDIFSFSNMIFHFPFRDIRILNITISSFSCLSLWISLGHAFYIHIFQPHNNYHHYYRRICHFFSLFLFTFHGMPFPELSLPHFCHFPSPSSSSSIIHIHLHAMSFTFPSSSFIYAFFSH